MPAAPSPLRQTFRALRHRNFRLFLGGQLVSLVGTWMQRVALSWLVFRLTGSAMLLGAVGFAGQIPTFVLAPLAGAWADRHDRKKLVVGAQVLAMLQAFALSALVLSGRVEVWHVLVLSAVLGLANAVDVPARQSFLGDMLEAREDLPNAIALNSSIVNAARLLGPALAGLFIDWFGEGPLFLANGVSYLAVLAALQAMRLPPRATRPPAPPLLQHLREGLGYAWRSVPIRAVLVLLALVSLMGIPYTVLMPVFAARVLGGGPHTLGFLTSSAGAGALGGALYLAGRRSVRGLGRIIPSAAATFGVGLLGLSLSHRQWISYACLFVAGAGMMVAMAASNTLLQTIVDEDKRGRVMSFYTMAFMGTAPFGSLLTGVLATGLGAPAAVAIAGLACLLGAASFARHLPRLRSEVGPIYRRLGILPEIAGGVAAASELTTPPQE